MANIEHKLIADGDRHEPKGSTAATLGQVLKSAGDGSTFFGFVNQSEIVGATVGKGYQQVLYGSSVASIQQPSALDVPVQIEFGSAQSLTDVTLSGTGLITFVTPGQYLLEIFMRFGRTTGAGLAILFSRFMKNGTQFLNSNSITLQDSTQTIPYSATLMLDVVANDNFLVELVRSSSGINNGGLSQTVPTTAGWSISPSASIMVSKYKGNA